MCADAVVGVAVGGDVCGELLLNSVINRVGGNWGQLSLFTPIFQVTPTKKSKAQNVERRLNMAG